MKEIKDSGAQEIAPPEEKPATLTPPKGMAAMQGHSPVEDSAAANDKSIEVPAAVGQKTGNITDDGSITSKEKGKSNDLTLSEGKDKEVHVPTDKLIAQMPPLTASEYQDLNIAAEHANSTKATRFHANHGNGSINEYHRIRSEISEDLAHFQLNNSIRADPYSVGGHNFPGYDIFGTNEMCSVKCYSLQVKDGEIHPRLGAYRKEFNNIIAADSNSNLKSAERLIQIRESDPHQWQKLQVHLPQDVLSSNTQAEMASAISNESTMRIPEDQIKEVKENLTTYYQKKLMQDRNMAEAEAFQLANQEVNKRVLSIDPRYKTAHYQGMAAKILVDRTNST